MRLPSFPIAYKLPAVIVSLCLVASLGIAIVGYRDFQRGLINEVQNSFQVIADSRSTALSGWAERVEEEVRSLGEDPTVRAAASAFNSSFGLMIDSDGLRSAYIAENPNPVGEKDKLDRAEASVPYNFQHGTYHPFFRQIAQAQGYGDVYLFTPAGQMLYSFRKNPDFAMDFNNVPFAETGLADLVRRAAAGNPEDVYFADFAPYGPMADAPTAFLGTGITDEQGAVIGVVAVQVPTAEKTAILKNGNGLQTTGEIFLIGADGITRSESRFPDRFGPLTPLDGYDLPDADGAGSQLLVLTTSGVTGEAVYAKTTPLRFFDTDWGLVSEIDAAEVIAPALAVRNKMMAVSGLVVVLSILAGLLIARSVTVPLRNLGQAMERLSERDYDSDIPGLERRDEIGALSSSLLDFRDKLAASDAAAQDRIAEQEAQSEVVARLSKALGRLASRDLSDQLNKPFPPGYEALRRDYNQTLHNLSGAIGAVMEHARMIQKRAEDTSRSSEDLSRRTESQAATLEQTATALDELTASVRSAAEGAREVESVVQNARKDAEDSVPVVQNAVQAMTNIENSSTRISQIIGVIDDIAFQTNLLALNAGVEAARAGEAGRGFAVVASEVRALAQRSSDAAREIKGLIGASSEQVSEGVSLVGQAGDVLTRIASHINHISGLIGDIASGAAQQSAGLGEINIGVIELDKVTQQNAAMVEEATASGHALNAEATALSDLMAGFTLPPQGGLETGMLSDDTAHLDMEDRLAS